jgi:hypothetical protein
MWPLLSVGIQAFGTIKWFLISGARFDGACGIPVLHTKKYELCALDGPKLALTELVLVTITACCYLGMLITR